MSAGNVITLDSWREFIEAKIGFVLPSTQYGWLSNAIARTATKYNLSQDDLYKKVSYDKTLRQELINTVLIAETRFFRHRPSMDFVVQAFLAHVATTPKRRFHVLSVGCSEGHEPWTIAMMLHQQSEGLFRVLGLDASTQSLNIAKKAQYPLRELDDIPDEFYYDIKIDIQKGFFSPVTALQSMVDFSFCNIFEPKSLEIALENYGLHKVDVIVCQNVLIYFRRFDQRDILNRLSDKLNDNGYLVLAGGEGLFWQHDAMCRVVSDSVNAWQKIRLKD